MNAKRSTERSARSGWIAAGLFLLAGVGLGLFLGSGNRLPFPSGSPEARPAQEMEGMEGMVAGADGSVRIAPAATAALGITSVAAEVGPLRRRIRSTGHVTYDETRLSRIAPKFGGWIERLHVDFTGRFVREGEPLLEIYSPELVSAQEELLAAGRLEATLAESPAPGVRARTGDLLEAARRRLLLWDVSPEQIEAIEESRDVRRTLTLHAPTRGFVVEKDAELGGRVDPGTTLYRIADLSRVWLEVDVFERDLRFARVGETVEVHVDALGGEGRTGRISYVYPDVRRDTRTGRVRVELQNHATTPEVKPGMFATVHLDAPVAERAVHVPRDAVMHSGDRDLVFVEREPGSYEIREVRVGATAGGRTQIVRGLLAGERVVARANFILDAESRLMETMMGQPDMPGMEMDMEIPGMEMDDADAPEAEAGEPGSPPSHRH